MAAKLYSCKICGFSYADKKTADECESWCSANNSCNLEIIKKAVKTKD